MIDISGAKLQETITAHQEAALFWYTPLCGTCKVGARMLEVVEAALPGLRLFSVNVNTSPGQAHEWKIESVPCLMIIRNGEPAERTYRMESVPALYNILKAIGTREKRK